eukprot:m.854067 g.854067  ORF g.854067 m.854067 type:complete len:58 (+) comp59616_c2_seq9:3963-4136(+)
MLPDCSDSIALTAEAINLDAREPGHVLPLASVLFQFFLSCTFTPPSFLRLFHSDPVF